MTYSAKLAQANDRVGLIVMAALFTPMIIASVVLRLYARKLKRVPYGADDLLALIGLCFVLALNGIFLGGTIEGAITGHSPIVNNWPATTELEHLAQKYKYAFQTTEKVTFGILKLSLLFLWKRIFGSVQAFVVACWIMIAFISAWSLAFFFATLFQCGTRWTWNWAPIGIFLTQCTDTLSMLTVFTATDLLTDFIIMFMPLPLIWKLHMPMKQKIGVSSIFMVGLFTIGAGIARMYTYLVTSYDKQDNPDFIADFTLFILWSEVEANVAMLVCSMPTFGPVIGRARDHLVRGLRKTPLSRWSILHPSRPDSGKSLQDEHELTHPSNILKRSLSERSSFNEIVPWQGRPAVTADGYCDNEERAGSAPGITARTEIKRTFEARSNDAWRRGRQSEGGTASLSKLSDASTDLETVPGYAV